MSNLFAVATNYTVGSGPWGVAIADVNADGKPDIVATNGGVTTVSVLLNSGTGTTLAFATQVTYSVGVVPYGVAIADVNVDGKPDIVATNRGGNTVSVLLNSGTGTTLAFATQVTYSVGSNPVGVAIADVNADGKPDIVAANSGGTTVSVLLNSGTGTTLAFATQVTYSVGSSPYGVAIADVNADGKPDIVAANTGGGTGTTVSVLLNSGTGTTLAFATQVTYSVGSGPAYVAIADVNADGKPDIVAANSGGGTTVSVLLNSGTGTTLAFATQVTYTVGSGPDGVAIADVNADGKPDIVDANYGGGTVSVLLNSGTGTTLAFATQVTYSVGSYPVGVAIADVNADGKPDIVAANNGGGTVSVLLNSGHTPTRTVSHTATRTSSRSEVSNTPTYTSSTSKTSSLSGSFTQSVSPTGSSRQTSTPTSSKTQSSSSTSSESYKQSNWISRTLTQSNTARSSSTPSPSSTPTISTSHAPTTTSLVKLMETLEGTPGNDVFLINTSSNFVISGNGGADVFSINNTMGSASINITDFSQGTDRVVLAGFNLGVCIKSLLNIKCFEIPPAHIQPIATLPDIILANHTSIALDPNSQLILDGFTGILQERDVIVMPQNVRSIALCDYPNCQFAVSGVCNSMNVINYESDCFIKYQIGTPLVTTGLSGSGVERCTYDNIKLLNTTCEVIETVQDDAQCIIGLA